MIDEKEKYFLFSFEQMKQKTEVEAKIGKKYKTGRVLVKGNYKQYTEISNFPYNKRFSDTIVVTSGKLSEMKYKDGEY